MTSEPHQNIGGGGGGELNDIWASSNIFFFLGGLNDIRDPTQIVGAQLYSSPTKISGGSVMLSEPHQKQIGGWGWWYLSPTKILGGGGAQRYLSPTKIWGVLNDIRVPPKYLGVSMISEIHQIYWGEGSMISKPHQIIGGGDQWHLSPTKILGGGGAQWYLSIIKHIGGGGLNDIWAPPKYWGAQWNLSPTNNNNKKWGGGGSMISEPHQNIGEAQWYPSPTNILGGGAQWYPRSTQNIGGGGSMISEPYQNIFWGSMICEIRCLSPPPPLPK